MLRKLFIVLLAISFTKCIYADITNILEDKNKTKDPSTKSDSKTDDKTKQPAEPEHIILSEKDLQNILDKFSADDKKVIKDIQEQISNWPENVFKEIRDYREFVIDAHKKAEAKYNMLSPAAKEAITIEVDLKSKLSPDAIKLLNNVELQK